MLRMLMQSSSTHWDPGIAWCDTPVIESPSLKLSEHCCHYLPCTGFREAKNNCDKLRPQWLWPFFDSAKNWLHGLLPAHCSAKCSALKVKTASGVIRPQIDHCRMQKKLSILFASRVEKISQTRLYQTNTNGTVSDVNVELKLERLSVYSIIPQNRSGVDFENSKTYQSSP